MYFEWKANISCIFVFFVCFDNLEKGYTVQKRPPNSKKYGQVYLMNNITKYAFWLNRNRKYRFILGVPLCHANTNPIEHTNPNHGNNQKPSFFKKNLNTTDN